MENELKGTIRNIVLKHFTGMHNQKRHGYRGDDTNNYYSTLQRIRKTGDQKEVDTFLFRWASAGGLPFAGARKQDLDKKGFSEHELKIIKTGFQKYIDKGPANSKDSRKALLTDFLNAVAEQKLFS